jgi:hypothetical protein
MKIAIKIETIVSSKVRIMPLKKTGYVSINFPASSIGFSSL